MNSEMMEVLEGLGRADDPQALFDAMMREDFGLFLRKAAPELLGAASLNWNWHLEAIAWRLSRVGAGEITRLLITLPPRHLKSITVSVAWVAWTLGRHPDRTFLCVSYSNELSAKLARQCRQIMETGWYRRVFPHTRINRARQASHDFDTTAGGGRFSTSVTGTLTGRGADIIIIDDPIKPEEANSETTRRNVNDWFRSTLVSRLNDKQTGAIITVMQRLHDDDLAGNMIRDGGWDQLLLPAVATEDEQVPIGKGRCHQRREGDLLHFEREPTRALAQLKRELGSIAFAAQYQQQPVPPQGNMVKREWFGRWRDLPPEAVNAPVFMAWDTASKDGIHSDWSVCVVGRVHKRKVWLIDVFRARLTFPGLKANAIRLARDYNARNLLIEDAASGMQLIQTLRSEAPDGVAMPIAIKPDGDKVSRFVGITAAIEAGQLVLPEQADWLAEFEQEVLGFPNAKHDDQADALAHLMQYVNNSYRETSFPAGPILFDGEGNVICDGSGIFDDEDGTPRRYHNDGIDDWDVWSVY